MIRNFRRSGQEPDLSLMSQGENAYLVLRGVFHVSPPALGGLPIDGKLTFSNNAYLKLTTEWIMLHGELAIGSVAAPLAPRLLRCGRHHGVNQERDTRPQNPQGRSTASAPSVAGADARGPDEPPEILVREDERSLTVAPTGVDFRGSVRI